MSYEKLQELLRQFPDVTIEYDIAPLSEEQVKNLKLNYAYGKTLVRDAMVYLFKTYPGRERAALALLGELLE